jgi:50S ribosome-binding GTPase
VTPQQLLAQLVRDFDTVYRAYARAGLLAGAAQTETAQKLLGSGDDVYRFTRAFLLTDALLRNRVGRLVADGGSHHLAVFGGNNVGKSTVVNILAAEQVASTSPEGAHTRHAQAFCAPAVQGERRRLFGENPYAFYRFTPTAVGALDRAEHDRYGIGSRSSPVLPPDVVLWDMPDCDATGSRMYIDAVVEAVTVADVVIYVTSVERYAVAHLLEWVFLLHDAGIDVVECLNKTRRRDQERVIAHQRRTHFPEMARQLALPAPDPPIVGLRYLLEGEEDDLWGPEHPEAVQLRATALEMLARTDRAQAGAKALTFVTRHVDRLLEPAWMEVRATEQWAAAVAAAVQDFVTIYAQAYLPSHQVIEPFSRLNLAILALLDPNIPGLQQALHLLRWMTRWPARLVLAMGRQVLSVMLSGGEAEADTLPPELHAYSEAHRVVLSRLGGLIERASQAPRHHPFWEVLRATWTAELTPLSERFGEYIQRHMVRTEHEITQAAQDIYAQLQQRPFLLNTLRSVRVTANVGGVLVGFLLPVHGGIVQDLLEELVIAPALVTGVEAATTGAVASFVSSRRTQLIEQLLEDARTAAVQLYYTPLLSIAHAAMQQTSTLGVGKDILARLPATLAQLQAQLAVPACGLTAGEDTHGIHTTG